MDSLYAIRRRNLERLNEEMFQGKKRGLAKAIDKHESQVSRWLAADQSQRHNVGEQIAREIEKALNLAPGYLDQEHGNTHKPKASEKAGNQTRWSGRHIAVSGSILTGLTMDAGSAMRYIEWATGDADAFIVHVDTDEYMPRMRRNELLCVEPSRELKPGNQVLVKMRNDQRLHVFNLLFENRQAYNFALVPTGMSQSFARKLVEWCYYIAAILDEHFGIKQA